MQFKHPFKNGRVTIAGKLDMGLHPKTLKSILKQADIDDILRMAKEITLHIARTYQV